MVKALWHCEKTRVAGLDTRMCHFELYLIYCIQSWCVVIWKYHTISLWQKVYKGTICALQEKVSFTFGRTFQKQKRLRKFTGFSTLCIWKWSSLLSLCLHCFGITDEIVPSTEMICNACEIFIMNCLNCNYEEIAKEQVLVFKVPLKNGRLSYSQSRIPKILYTEKGIWVRGVV